LLGVVSNASSIVTVCVPALPLALTVSIGVAIEFPTKHNVPTAAKAKLFNKVFFISPSKYDLIDESRSQIGSASPASQKQYFEIQTENSLHNQCQKSSKCPFMG